MKFLLNMQVSEISYKLYIMVWSCEVCGHEEFDLTVEEVTCQLCEHSVMFTSSNNNQKDKEKNDGGGEKRSFDVEAETDTAGMNFIYHYYYHYQLKCLVFILYIKTMLIYNDVKTISC